ncbi:MAG: hypothetical protein DRJ45_07900 [Thermoprotei archaeon]|nr:MAG: hypothetical protein DRJ45_07900 [Thermoprotei archaeon]
MDLLLILVFMLAFYIAWGIGSNDETMASVAGIGLFSLNTIVLLGGLMDFLGAIIFGYKVEETLGKGILIASLSHTDVLIIIFSIASWLIIASYKGWPISTTHSAIGALLGCGIIKFGIQSINFNTLYNVFLGLILSPIFGLFSAMFIEIFLDKIFLNYFKGLEKRLILTKIFSILLLIFTLITAFFRGANDIANATAFLSIVYGESLYIRIINGIGMALGLIILGRRVIKSVGNTLIELTPLTAFSVQISVALIMSIGTLLGIPISGTHVLVSAIIGTGIIRKIWINIKGVREILFTWIITFPGAALLSLTLSLLLS